MLSCLSYTSGHTVDHMEVQLSWLAPISPLGLSSQYNFLPETEHFETNTETVLHHFYLCAFWTLASWCTLPVIRWTKWRFLQGGQRSTRHFKISNTVSERISKILVIITWGDLHRDWVKIQKRPLLPVIRWTKWKLVIKLPSLFTIAAQSDCIGSKFVLFRVG